MPKLWPETKVLFGRLRQIGPRRKLKSLDSLFYFNKTNSTIYNEK